MAHKTEAEIRSTLDAVIQDLESHQHAHHSFVGNVETVAREVSNLAGRMEQRFEQVDRRFDEVDKRFEQVDRRFAEVDKRFDRLERRMDSFEANVKTEFGLVHDSLRKMDARIERLVGYIVRDELGPEGQKTSAT